MTRLVTKTELAQLAGVAKPSITKACKRQFPGACVGPRVDLDHPDVQKYLSTKDGAATRAAARLFAPTPEPTAVSPSTKPPGPASLPPAPKAPRPPSSRRDDVDDDANVEHYLDMTLREIIEKHGTLTRFDDLLDARKRISDIHEKDLKNAERTGRLIPRDFVSKHLFGYLSTLQRQVMRDTAVTLARRLFAMARAGTSVEEGEATARELLGAQFASTREQFVHAMREDPDEAAAA